MNHEHKSNGVEFQCSPRQPRSERKVLKNPTLRYQVRHHSVKAKTRRDGSAFEVFAFSSCVLGKSGDSYVEASETSEAAEDKEGQTEVVDGCAQAQGEGHRGRCNAERDLCYISAGLAPTQSRS